MRIRFCWLAAGWLPLILSSAALANLGDIQATYNFSNVFSMVDDPVQPLIYISAGNNLEIVNTNTLAVVASVPFASQIYGLAVSPNNTLYIAGGVSDCIYTLNTNTLTLGPTLSVGAAVTGEAVGLNNRLFVEASTTIEQIDATTGASTGPNFGVWYPAGGLQISPDRKTLYYSQGGSPVELDLFDVSTTTPTVKWSSDSIGGNMENLVLSHDGSMLADVCGWPYDIPVLNTSTMTPVATLNTGAYPDDLAFSPDDKLAYTSQWPYPDQISVYDLANSAIVGQFTISSESTQMMVDNSGQHLFAYLNDFSISQAEVEVYDTGVPEPSGVGIAIACAAWRSLGRFRRRNG